MSDGERSALLLAADVLTSDHDSILIIDEPERHLHRSISSQLVRAVIAERPDCHIVLLTHDLDLAASIPQEAGSTFSLLDCAWNGEVAVGWDLQVVPPSGPFPETARVAILGGRQRLLFIEGEPASLDLPLYEILFPGWSFTASGGCEQVIRNVSGLRSSSQLHWIEPVGIVDNDGRTQVEIDALARQGVHVLTVNEIENLYSSAPVLTAVAEYQSKATGKTATELITEATAAALAAIASGDTAGRIAAAVGAETARRKLVEQLPGPKDLLASGSAPISFSVDSPLLDLQNRLTQLQADNDLDAIINEYPIKETGVAGQITAKLGFQRPVQYERVARHLMSTDDDLRAKVTAVVGQLPV